MTKFRMEKDFLEIFPDAMIGILVCRGIDNKEKDETKTIYKQKADRPHVTTGS